MTRSGKNFAVVFFLLFTFTQAFAQENLLNYANTLKFARFLRSSGQLGFAIEEYERLNYLLPNDSVARIELMQTCRTSKNCEKLSSLFATARNEKKLTYPGEFASEYLRTALTCKTSPADYFNVSSVFGPEEKAFYNLSYYWVHRDYRNASAFCFENTQNLIHKNPDLYQLTVAFQGEKYKSPALAGIMSAILPGSGKAYSKRWGDAAISFLFIGTNAFTAYRGFHKRGVKSFNGWFFGGLAFSFYSAGIWGSAKAAKNYNEQLQTNYQNNAERIIYSHF